MGQLNLYTPSFFTGDGGGKSYWIGTRTEGTSGCKVPEGGGRVDR